MTSIFFNQSYHKQEIRSLEKARRIGIKIPIEF